MRSTFAMVMLLLACGTAAAAQDAGAPGAWSAGTPVVLFDGRSLDRWTATRFAERSRIARDSLPKVVDGAMRVTARDAWTHTVDIFRSFRLTLNYRLPDGAATLYFRAWPRLDDLGRPVNASLFDLPALDDRWHVIQVECRDGHAQISLDGAVIAETDDVKNSAGHIGVRAHEGAIEIREVTLTPLRAADRSLPGLRPRRDGNWSMPRLIHEEKPEYTMAAMREFIEGAIWMEVMVREDGTVGDVLITESLDPVYGLDQHAIDAVRRWRFEPATRDNTPVATVVSIEMTFKLR